ncbi:transposase (fragment) [Vibrio crassostreae]
MNGKVERSQKTDKSEFYPTIDISVGLEELDLLLAEWQHYYNWERPHSSLNGLAPIDRVTEMSDQTTLFEEVSQHSQTKKERFQEQNYKLELQLRKLKPSL